MKFIYIKTLLLLVYSTFLVADDYTCANPKTFEAVYKYNEYSKLIQIGNTSLCADDNNDGVCEDPGTATNNAINMIHNDFDNDSVTILNSSAAYLDIPAGKTVLWAGLFWQGYMAGTWTSTQKDAGKMIKYKHENDTYQTESNATMNWVYFSSTRMYYQSFIEITDYVNQNGAGYYWVGDIATTTGKPAGGSFGAWSMTVVYKDTTEEYKNTTIFHGYQAFAGSTDIDNAQHYATDNNCSSNTGVGNNVVSTLTGFLTPKKNTVNSTLVVFAGEGDIGISGDSGSLTDISGTEYSLTNAVNPSTNIMNATISRNGVIVTTGKPYYSNNSLGADIDTYDVSSILNNSQSSTDIKFSTSGDGYMPGMYALETQIYVPQLCYDYAYGQYGKFYTEDYNSSIGPKITGNFAISDPLDVKLFIRNEEASDIIATDLYIHILDINTSQATYTRESTRLTKPSTINIVTVPDSSLVVSDSYVQNIDVGDIDSKEYFYTYYQLDLSTNNIDMPIHARVDYNITVASGVTIPYKINIDSEMPICSGASTYSPVPGRFNMVHNNYYNDSTTYYNLPTQVTSREGNFKVIALDENNTDELQGVSTIVAVELIDASAFHDTEASCQDQESAISQRVWVLFENNSTESSFNRDAILNAIIEGRTTINSSSDFYQSARENAAFRVSYNIMDGDGSIPYLDKQNNGSWALSNWESTWTGETCVQDMTTNGLGNDNTVANYCNLTGGSPDDLALCMECIYGSNTKFVCSRDNFSIRPEAFMIHIDDQNQTDTSVQTDITLLNHSGSTGATAPVLNLSAGYKYNLEVNATNHVNNTPSSGYIKTITADSILYTWEPRSTITPNACNDENDKEFSTKDLNFHNGSSDQNTSVDQVGEYRLSILDKTWTAADKDPISMAHHIGAYFLDASIPDCQIDTAITQTINSSALNGCNISSNHLNPDNLIVYNDYNVTFHPYKFDVTNITPSVGINHNQTITNDSFIYMSDLSQDENMSFHLNGTISAVGYDDSNLSNFVDQCYAKNVSIDINTSLINTPVAYQYKLNIFDNINNSGNPTRVISNDFNNSTDIINLLAIDFNKTLQGATSMTLNLNYTRRKDIPVNPQSIAFNNYNVECTTSSECTFNANLLNNKTTQGTKEINATIKHYYGRTNAPRQRFVGDTGVALIYYEAYCSTGTIGVCDKTLLADGVDSNTTNDPRWFINTKHLTATHGDLGTVKQRSASASNTGIVTVTAINDTNATLTYDETKGYPYKTTMDNNASTWLIYNKYNASAMTNEFEVEFIGASGAWSGKDSANSTVNTSSSIKTNRRSMW